MIRTVIRKGTQALIQVAEIGLRALDPQLGVDAMLRAVRDARAAADIMRPIYRIKRLRRPLLSLGPWFYIKLHLSTWYHMERLKWKLWREGIM